MKKKLGENNGPKKKEREREREKNANYCGATEEEVENIEDCSTEREGIQTKLSMEGENRNVLAPSSNARGACAVVGKLGSAFS